MSSLFCRHNRFTADCAICSKGTVLDKSLGTERPRRSTSSGASKPNGRSSKGAASRQFSGPNVSAGPYERDIQASGTGEDPYEVRLEKVPGGVRLAQWSRGLLERRAPELPEADLRPLVQAAIDKELLDARDRDRLISALEPADGSAAPAEGTRPDHGASPGRAGDLKEELRVERVGDDRIRIGRWLFWPGRGWELQEAPPMFPAKRYAEALQAAVAAGVLTPGARAQSG